jgi:alginate O-acetyltransferase complex protein AlgI
MLFNSLHFLLFFPIVVGIWALLPQKWKNAFLLVASYYFYMCWSPPYIILIIFITLVDYVSGIGMGQGKAKNRHRKRALLFLGLVCNLGLLFTMKYFGFFQDNLAFLVELDHVDTWFPKSLLLLAIGISFHVFRSLSCMIEVYQSKYPPERNLLDFALYVAFFPPLLGGPIERSRGLRQQLEEPRTLVRC